MLALILIFMVLAAQFNSFIDPFIIMVTVPLALAGGLLSLWIFDQTINIFSQIGMIMLIGLVTKNGILIVEFAKMKMEDGQDAFSAAVDAAKLRFISNTSNTTIDVYDAEHCMGQTTGMLNNIFLISSSDLYSVLSFLTRGETKIR